MPSLLPPATKHDVGEVGICSLDWDKKDTSAADLGRIEHFGFTKLLSKDEKQHEDGPVGEIFVKTYGNSKKITAAKRPCR